MATATESLISRRHLLRLGVLAGVGAPILATIPFGLVRAAGDVYCNPSRPSTPQAALDALIAGNKHWADEDQTHPGEDKTRRDCLDEHHQTPFAAILSCVDSRVPPELLFDQGLGDLFPARVAGNSVVPILEDSLRYGTEHLGAQVLFVLGHSKCGAVDAAVKFYLNYVRMFGRDPDPADLSLSPDFIFILPILPAVKAARKIVKKQGGDPNDVDQVNPVAIDQHVILTGQYLLARNPFRHLIKKGKLLVKGGRYDLDTQLVNILL